MRLKGIVIGDCEIMISNQGANKYTDTIAKAEQFNLGSKLCERGFYITDSNEKNILPHFAFWNVTSVSGFAFYIHPNQALYLEKTEGGTFFLIGHAYNPYTDAISEEIILKELARAEQQGKTAYLEYVNTITGVFLLGKIEHNGISILLDCAGMMSGFYGVINNRIVITSHTALPAMIFGLQQTEYVKQLLQYRFYRLYGSFLPGDISPYREIKRIVPNTIVKIESERNIQIERFFPSIPNEEINTEEEYNAQIQRISVIMKKTLELIARKWDRPSISLTGGMDSKTTLSSAKDHYKAFSYFSYVTSQAERIDADAAHSICDVLGISHRIHEISTDPDDYEEYQAAKAVLELNKDFIGHPNQNDVCKRIYYAHNVDFDVEVKSWVSEIARANYCKKFGKKKMPEQITARRCSSLYKIFLHNRKLLHQTDEIFDEYIRKTRLRDHLYNYDWSDLFLWEIRYGGWGGLVITGEHKYSYDITIPYNNRKLLQMMLAVPLEKRRKDLLHRDLIQCMNPNVDALGITITNLNETKFREFCEKCYFNLNSNLPF